MTSDYCMNRVLENTEESASIREILGNINRM